MEGLLIEFPDLFLSRGFEPSPDFLTLKYRETVFLDSGCTSFIQSVEDLFGPSLILMILAWDLPYLISSFPIAKNSFATLNLSLTPLSRGYPTPVSLKGLVSPYCLLDDRL